jgi:hypothetical protein
MKPTAKLSMDVSSNDTPIIEQTPSKLPDTELLSDKSIMVGLDNIKELLDETQIRRSSIGKTTEKL